MFLVHHGLYLLFHNCETLVFILGRTTANWNWKKNPLAAETKKFTVGTKPTVKWRTKISLKCCKIDNSGSNTSDETVYSSEHNNPVVNFFCFWYGRNLWFIHGIAWIFQFTLWSTFLWNKIKGCRYCIYCENITNFWKTYRSHISQKNHTPDPSGIDSLPNLLAPPVSVALAKNWSPWDN